MKANVMVNGIYKSVDVMKLSESRFLVFYYYDNNFEGAGFMKDFYNELDATKFALWFLSDGQ